MPITCSPLRYPGGKTALAPFLLSVLKANGLAGGEYAEPYAGGAGAALELLFGENVERIWINDADYHIYAFWMSCLTNATQLLEMVEQSRMSIHEWRKQREIYLHPKAHTRLAVGYATFYLNRCNHSGILLKAGPIGGMEQSGKWKISARFNVPDLKKRIERINTYAERIHVTNLDAILFVKNILIPKSNLPKLLVYFDPPYYVRGSELYLNHYLHKDHEKLYKYIKKQDRFKWLISYDNCTEVRNIYKEMEQLSFGLNYSVNRVRVGNELLVYNKNIALPPISEIGLNIHKFSEEN